MLFNSFEFLLFFPIVTILYFLLPHKWGLFLLLAASCFFYMFFKPEYILILGFTIVVDYYAGILLEREADKKKKKIWLVMSLIANIGVLAIFKYYNFFNENITGVAQFLGYKNPMPFLKMALPIGLSFHTFQAMSYTIEVYRGNQKAERNFSTYALYVMFYPQLVAGPIERPQNILHQFYEEHKFNYPDVVFGLRQMLWGLFKKAVIADRLALVVDPIYNHPANHSATSIVVATVFFAFEIYCDFSGYSDIALGTARVMGYKLMTNFNKPYNARNVSEFWKKWHISLSSWFKDYLYIPLGGNRVPLPRIYINILIVFVLSGFWHGASWNYVIWGLLNGLALIYELVTHNVRHRILGKLPAKIRQMFGQVCTFIFICFTWIFFRANSLPDALFIVRKIPGFVPELLKRKPGLFANLFGEITLQSVLWGGVVILILEFAHFVEGRGSMFVMIGKQPRAIRMSLYAVLIFAIYFWGIFNNRQFIYFQF